ncbi:MAG TPA: hypothetical protein VNB06_03220 [Thermoanaerobaculia bacterium]|nr:hypothetical protein [Thermoanaerobaculia bacterium]
MALDLFDELTGLLADLERGGAEYAIAGAIALAIHGVPRATADIDLLVPGEHVERALEIARGRGFTVAAAPMRFSDGQQLRRVTKLQGEDALTLDLLIVGPALEAVWAERVSVPLEDGSVWVVSRQGLVQMKALAGRDQDFADIRRLQEADR